MQLKAEHIKDKGIVGTTSKGEPVIHVETHGGLHCLFVKRNNGDIDTLATAPHKGIARYLAESKEGENEIKWNNESNDLDKSAQDLFESFRVRILSPQISLSKTECNHYLYYDPETLVIEMINKSDLSEVLPELNQFGFLRIADCTDQYCLVKDWKADII